MKKRTDKKIVLITSLTILILSIILAAGTTALGTQLYCLDKGQVIEFSKCNPAMQDKKCLTTSCQICANEIRSGVYCPANINQCDNSCVRFEEKDAQSPPQPTQPTTSGAQKITLLKPEENYIQAESSVIDFTFKVTQSYTINKCSLVIDDDEVASTSSRIQSRTNKISFPVEEGLHSWEIRCITRDEKTLINSEQREITIGDPKVSNQTIELISPTDNFSAEGTQAILFAYNLSESMLQKTKECNLLINGEVAYTDQAINKTEIQHSLNPGSYDWKINCIDTKNKTIESQARKLTLNALSPPAQNSGGTSNSGSTVGGVIFEKKENKKKTEVNNTLPIEQLSQNTAESGEQNAENENSPESTEESTQDTNTLKSAITGAVIGLGSKLKDKKSIAIAFIIIVLAGLIALSLLRKKQEDKAIKKMIQSLA